MGIVTLDGGLRGVSGRPWAGVRYFCTLRTGGASEPPWDSLNLGLHVRDDTDAVMRNRALLRTALPDDPLWLEQVHGTRVCDADTWASPAAPGADAAVTAERDRPLVILTADCLPVVLADTTGSVLGVAHAGWRGLAAGVLENTLEQLRQRRPDASGWCAWVGPAIGPAAFEVGPEVRAAFIDHEPGMADHFVHGPADGDRWYADLPGIARARLLRNGVEHVELSGECTYTLTDRYFSYRRSARCGRQATVAWLV